MTDHENVIKMLMDLGASVRLHRLTPNAAKALLIYRIRSNISGNDHVPEYIMEWYGEHKDELPGE